MPLKTDFIDSDVMATVHAAHHNAMAVALNDSDIVAFAALAPANDSILQRKAGTWVGSTPATVKTDLALTKTDVGLSNVDNTADVSKPVSTAVTAAIADLAVLNIMGVY